MKENITETDVGLVRCLVVEDIRLAVKFWVEHRDCYDELEAAMLEAPDAYLEAWR